MISLIIPVYNCEKYIKRCVDSVTAQSFEDFELIAVNDGSTDSTGAILDSLAKVDRRIRVLHKENGGVSSARNAGLDMARGEYISFADGDDFLPADYLATLYRAVWGADIALCDIACIKDGKEARRFTCKKESLSKYEAIELLLSRKEINSGPYGKLFSAAVVRGCRFPEMKTYEDILFVLDAFKNAEIIKTTALTEYVYDQGTGGVMTSIEKTPSTDVVTMANRVLEYLDSEKGNYSDEPEYTTLSHLMMYLKPLFDIKDKTTEQKQLAKAIMDCFKGNKRRIKKNKLFSFKEKALYLFAAHGYRIKGGLAKI